MTKNLYLEIERAENFADEADRLQQAIVALSKNDVAATVLIDSFRDALINNELAWLTIQRREDFKAKYGDDRDKAIADFLSVMLDCNGNIVE